LESFGLFVGDIITGVGLCILVEVTRPWMPIPRVNFLTQVFSGNLAVIRVITALDWLSSISDQNLLPKIKIKIFGCSFWNNR